MCIYHNHGGDIATHNSSASTTYFVTFKVDSGDRIELAVPGQEYGLLAQGDDGSLTFQGARYKGLERYR